MTGETPQRDGGVPMSEIRARHPSFREAVLGDLRLTSAHRFERHEFRSPLDAVVRAMRLAWVSDAFLAQVLYRVKTRLQAWGVPVLPRVSHRMAMSTAGLSIGDPVVVHPGVYIVHGQVVIDGFVEIHSGTVISPFVTIGLRGGDIGGPTLGPDVSIGTGAKILGSVRVGQGAKIGANAVVVDDVAESATVIGIPARPVDSSQSASERE